jgi:precorrin-2 dehydrogenase/sirohydrochlorin ferrochelatase
MHERYYPVFLSLHDKVCLIVGGGTVGERKTKGLLGSGASIRIVAEKLTRWLETECRDGRVTLIGSSYQATHLNDVDIVFAATNDAELNRRIAADARGRRLLCNMATDPELGSFIVPSVFQKGPLSVAISTAGLSPATARNIRKTLENQFGPEWALSLTLIGLLRSAIQSEQLEDSESQRLFRALAALPLPEWIKEERRDRALEEIGEICRPWLSREKLNLLWDEIWKLSSS